MPLLTQGELNYSVEDAFVYPYAAGVPGTGKDIPGIVRVEADPQVETAEVRGDNTVLASVASLSSIDLTIEAARKNLDAFAAMCGGLVATTGTTPAQIRTWTRNVTDGLSPFQIKAQTRSKTVDGGATRVDYPFCNYRGGGAVNLQDNELPTTEISASATADSAGKIFLVSQYESWTVLT